MFTTELTFFQMMKREFNENMDRKLSDLIIRFSNDCGYVLAQFSQEYVPHYQKINSVRCLTIRKKKNYGRS